MQPEASSALPVGSESPASVIGWSTPESPTRHKRLRAEQVATLELQPPVGSIEPVAQAQPVTLLFDPLPDAMFGVAVGKKQRRRGAAGSRVRAREQEMAGGPSALLLCGEADGSGTPPPAPRSAESATAGTPAPPARPSDAITFGHGPRCGPRCVHRMAAAEQEVPFWARRPASLEELFGAGLLSGELQSLGLLGSRRRRTTTERLG